MNTTKLDSLALWQLIILNEGKTFKTTGHGSRPGIEFTYEVSGTTSAAGRHYAGQSVPSYGNELWIITLPDGERKKKSISRSTVDLAYRTALEEQERSSFVSGPRKLGLPGVRSNLYAMFVQFGVIKSAPVSVNSGRDPFFQPCRMQERYEAALL